MKKSVGLLIVLLVVLVVGWFDPQGRLRGYLNGEPFFAGRAAHVWIGELTSSDPAVSEAAYQKLTAGGSDAMQFLAQILQRRMATPEVRWTAAEMLGKSGQEYVTIQNALVAALADPDEHVRTVAAEAVGKSHVPADTAVPELRKLLDKEPSVQVIRALSVYKGDAASAMERLGAIMNDLKLPTDVRWNAIRTIAKMGEAGASAVPQLIPLMQDEQETVREHAAEAMGDIGPAAKESIPALVKALSDPFHKARRDAVRSLGQIGPDAQVALPDIEKLLQDPEELVRKAAAKTIETLTGKAPAEAKPAGND